MKALGFGLPFINIFRGLLQGGQVKVHFNGHFTQDFPLQRGVRQGFPLAPLLFAISTQPLMTLLVQYTQQGRLSGIPILGASQLLHQLFANNTCLFLKATQGNSNATAHVIHIYE